MSEPDAIASAAGAPRGSVLRGMIWMFVVSVLLFWLPGLGSLIAGIVGGIKAGGVINGLLAGSLPAVVFGSALFMLATALTGMPLLGLVAGMGGFMLMLFYVAPLLIGAVIGGLFA